MSAPLVTMGAMKDALSSLSTIAAAVVDENGVRPFAVDHRPGAEMRIGNNAWQRMSGLSSVRCCGRGRPHSEIASQPATFNIQLVTTL